MTISQLLRELLDLVEDGRGNLEIKFEGGGEINSIKECTEPPTNTVPEWDVWYELSNEE